MCRRCRFARPCALHEPGGARCHACAFRSTPTIRRIRRGVRCSATTLRAARARFCVGDQCERCSRSSSTRERIRMERATRAHTRTEGTWCSSCRMAASRTRARPRQRAKFMGLVGWELAPTSTSTLIPSGNTTDTQWGCIASTQSTSATTVKTHADTATTNATYLTTTSKWSWCVRPIGGPVRDDRTPVLSSDAL